MRAVVQRVTEARVLVDGAIVGEIGKGLVVLLGVCAGDDEHDAAYMADKIVNLRIFDDEEGKMNIPLLNAGGSLLVVSQFTLCGDCRKGKRPSYDRAAKPEDAEKLYEKFVELCRSCGARVETGKFKAMMNVKIHNDGPVTLLLDSRKEF